MKNSWEENYKRACKENERISPWFWILLIAFIFSIALPFVSLGYYKPSDKDKEIVELLNKLREPVEMSQHDYDKFMKDKGFVYFTNP